MKVSGAQCTVCLRWKYFSFRLHGSYEALKYGTSLDGLSDLTGGIAESILLKPSYTSLLTTLNNLLKMTSIVLCKWDKDNQSDANQSVSAYFAKKKNPCYQFFFLIFFFFRMKPWPKLFVVVRATEFIHFTRY